MKRLLSTLFKWMVAIGIIFFLFQTSYAQNQLQVAKDWLQGLSEPATAKSVAVAPEKSDSAERDTILITNPQAPPETVDIPLIRQTILERTNQLRAEYGAGPLTENQVLQDAADVRALESAESFSHTRPNGLEFQSILEEDGFTYSYFLAGENLAMGTHHMDDEEMAGFLFDGWVESPGHFENMIEPRYEEIGIGVHYDGEFLYLVQIFGTPY